MFPVVIKVAFFESLDGNLITVKLRRLNLVSMFFLCCRTALKAVCDITNYDTILKKNRVTLFPVFGQKTACRFRDLCWPDRSERLGPGRLPLHSGQRHRFWNGTGRKRAYLRSLLPHQECPDPFRSGYRFGAVHRQEYHRSPPGSHRSRQSAGRGKHLSSVSTHDARVDRAAHRACLNGDYTAFDPWLWDQGLPVSPGITTIVPVFEK